MRLFSFVKWAPFSLIFPLSTSYLVAVGTSWCLGMIINNRKIHFFLLSIVLIKVGHITALPDLLEDEQVLMLILSDILQSLCGSDRLEMK